MVDWSNYSLVNTHLLSCVTFDERTVLTSSKEELSLGGNGWSSDSSTMNFHRKKMLYNCFCPESYGVKGQFAPYNLLNSKLTENLCLRF